MNLFKALNIGWVVSLPDRIVLKLNYSISANDWIPGTRNVSARHWIITRLKWIVSAKGRTALDLIVFDLVLSLIHI